MFLAEHNHSQKADQYVDESGQLSALDPHAAGFDIGKRVYRVSTCLKIKPVCPVTGFDFEFQKRFKLYSY